MMKKNTKSKKAPQAVDRFKFSLAMKIRLSFVEMAGFEQ